jgi:hypothetical protein
MRIDSIKISAMAADSGRQLALHELVLAAMCYRAAADPEYPQEFPLPIAFAALVAALPEGEIH